MVDISGVGPSHNMRETATEVGKLADDDYHVGTLVHKGQGEYFSQRIKKRDFAPNWTSDEANKTETVAQFAQLPPTR